MVASKNKKSSTGRQSVKRWLKKPYIKFALLPLLIYFLLFCFFTWPWITHFNGWFYTDGGDGLQNVWNVWWVNKSVTELGQLPWHTSFLHYPFGVTLVGQTLNPVNGFFAIPMLGFLSLNQAFNIMVIFSFLFGGLSALWLCYYFTKSYIPSVIGGAIFTFSSYHFAHAIGHMQLVSLEFVPLFILFWWMLLKRPTYRLAIIASISLLLVLWSDYYYFLYSLIFAGFSVIYLAWRKELPSYKDSKNWRPWLLFIGLTGLIVLPLPIALLLQNSRDEFTGSHPARIFSTDLATPVINGGFWKFHWLTDWYWVHIKGFVAETSVYLGISVIAVLAIAMQMKEKIHKHIVFMLAVGIFFGVMSFGPRLMVGGYSLERVPMPYVLMERVVPGMKLSGVPVRMMFMVTLMSAVIVAMVLSKLDLKKRKGLLLITLFCVVVSVEMWPRRLPLTPITQPRYVLALQNLPAGAVLDNAAKDEAQQLYHQTGYEKPMAFGYISRTPKSLMTKEYRLWAYGEEGKYDKMCSEFKLRYLTTPAFRPLKTSFPVVYQDAEALIYDIKNSPSC